jgi:hypothetical protein
LRAKAQEHSAKLFAGLDPAEQAKLFSGQQTASGGGGHLVPHHVTVPTANGSSLLQAQNGHYSAVDHSTSVF